MRLCSIMNEFHLPVYSYNFVLIEKVKKRNSSVIWRGEGDEIEHAEGLKEGRQYRVAICVVRALLNVEVLAICARLLVLVD